MHIPQTMVFGPTFLSQMTILFFPGSPQRMFLSEMTVWLMNPSVRILSQMTTPEKRTVVVIAGELFADFARRWADTKNPAGPSG